MEIPLLNGGVILTFPALLSIGNNGHYLRFADNTGTVARFVVTFQDMTFEGTPDNDGTCQLSIMPAIAQRFTDDPPEMTQTRCVLLAGRVKLYDNTGAQVDEASVLLSCIYGTITPRTSFAKTRNITYNPNAEQNFVTLLAAAKTINATNTVTGAAKSVRVPKAGLFGNLSLNGLVGLNEKKFNIVITGAGEIVNGALISSPLVVRGVVDKRIENALILSWYDANGLAHTRTFAKGVRGITGTTRETITSVVFTNFEDEKTTAKKDCKLYYEFGDTAIPSEFYDDVASLATATRVKCWLDIADPESIEVTIADFALTLDPKKHVFNFNAKMYLPELEII